MQFGIPGYDNLVWDVSLICDRIDNNRHYEIDCELQLGDYLHAQSRSKICKFRRDYAAKNIVFVHGILSVKTGTASTPSKAGMVAYQGGVHSVGVGIVIILLCFTNITSNIYLNNAT